MKCIIGLFLTFSAIFCHLSIVSGEESVSYAGQIVQPNCTSKMDIETCKTVCKSEKGLCIELPNYSGRVATSACLCGNKPAYTPEVRCEKGEKNEEDIIFAENDEHMEQCFKLTQAFPSIDYYSCSPAFRPLICAADDGSGSAAMQTRLSGSALGCSFDENSSVTDLFGCLISSLLQVIHDAIAKVVDIISLVLQTILSAISKIKNVLSGLVGTVLADARRRRAIN